MESYTGMAGTLYDFALIVTISNAGGRGENHPKIARPILNPYKNKRRGAGEDKFAL